MLGLIWTLILEYHVGKGKGKSGGSQGIRAQCEKLAGVPVQNLSEAFESGIILARMIDAKKPGLLKPDEMDPNEKFQNVEKCLDILENVNTISISLYLKYIYIYLYIA